MTKKMFLDKNVKLVEVLQMEYHRIILALIHKIHIDIYIFDALIVISSHAVDLFST
jgi:hypothetical protein